MTDRCKTLPCPKFCLWTVTKAFGVFHKRTQIYSLGRFTHRVEQQEHAVKDEDEGHSADSDDDLLESSEGTERPGRHTQSWNIGDLQYVTQTLVAYRSKINLINCQS